MTNEEKQKLLDELRPKGEWKGYAICSICEEVADRPSDFCPNCGADMRGTRK